ncbi:hypothetical protein [Kitasatospora sp. NPDC058046]|uniref:hypothetical protein n=1 Tax=Kitasatospora sp. NPDC058046 TaxID=3346312 RepID=UPI0036DCD3E5
MSGNVLNEEAQQVRDAIAGLFAEDTPEQRFVRLTALLQGWRPLHEAVREMRQEAGAALYDGGSGMTYKDIGGLISVTESRARQIAKGIVRSDQDRAKAEKRATADGA